MIPREDRHSGTDLETQVGVRFHLLPRCSIQAMRRLLILTSLFVWAFMGLSVFTSSAAEPSSLRAQDTDPPFLLDAYPEAYAAYSLRQLRSDYDGPAIRVRRSSDGAEQDFGFTSEGNLDVVAIENWLSGADGHATIWYSQKAGEPDLVQATVTAQPALASAGSVLLDDKGHPRLQFNGSRWFEIEALLSTPVPIHNMLTWVVGERGEGGVSDQGILSFEEMGSFAKRSLGFYIQSGSLTLRGSVFPGQVWIPSSGSRTVWGINTTGEAGKLQFFDGYTISKEVDLDDMISKRSLIVGNGSTDSYGPFTGSISEVVIFPGQSATSAVQDQYDSINAYWEVGPTGYDRTALLPQRFQYQVDLYDWLKTIDTADVDLPDGPLVYTTSGLTGEELATLWLESHEISHSRVTGQSSTGFVLDDGSGRGIEGSGDVRLLHTTGGGESKAWENEIAWWYRFDVPDGSGGQGNPYYQHPNVARRALVMTAVDMMMYHEQMLYGSGLSDADQYGKAFASWAYVYKHCKEILSADLQSSFESGFEHFMDRLIQQGARDVNTNMDIFSITAVAEVYASVDSATLKDKAVKAAKRVLLGAEDATLGGAGHDVWGGTFFPAGYIGENSGPETFYNSESYTLMLHAWSAVAEEPEWAFLGEMLRRMSEFRVYQHFRDPDGVYLGPAGYANRTGAPMIGGQNATPWRDIVAAHYFDEAKSLLKGAKHKGNSVFRNDMAYKTGQNLSDVTLGENWDGTLPQWNGWESWIKDVTFFPPSGWYDPLKTLVDADDPLVIPPFERNGNTFSKVFGGPPTGTEFWAHKSLDSSGDEWGFFVEADAQQGPYAGWYGGKLEAFWTRETGMLVLNIHDKTGCDPADPENTMCWDQADYWAASRVWGRDETSKVFDTVHIRANKESTLRTSVVDPDAATPYAEVTNVFNDPNTSRGGEETSTVIEGSLTIKNRFEALSNGVRGVHTITSNQADEASVLWATIPVFLRHADFGKQYDLSDATIEFWDGNAWQLMPEDQDSDGVPELVSTSALRIGRDFEDGQGTRYGFISFDGQNQAVRLSTQVYEREYQAWNGGERIRNVHIDLHGSPGTAQPLPASKSLTYTIQTTDPTTDDGGSGGGGGTSSQTIELQQGWNLVSARVTPADAGLETVLADVLSNVLLVKDEHGQIFSPSDNLNQIGAWDVNEAYMIYTDADVAFTLEGTETDPTATSIALNPGWNLVPFFGTAAYPVEDAVAPIADQLVLVKDDQGNVYYPESGINSIGDMQPGRGYKVYLNEETTLTYPSDMN